MKPEFTASCVRVEDLDEGIGIWLADADPVQSDYLCFSRVLVTDEPCSRSRMDEVYMERNDQAYSGDGGVVRITLFPDHLHLQLDEKGAKFMSGLSFMKVSFNLDVQAMYSLREGLAVCFNGLEWYRDEVEV